jgi:putative glycosyltransferase
MKISIVSTLYKSEKYLDEFLSECLSALTSIDCNDFEFVFVNDGSPDNSVVFLLEKRKTIKPITIIDLSRNFGHHYAIQAGLLYAKGDFVLLIDNDLETSPKVLIDFYNQIKSNPNLDMVFGYQEKRKGGFIEKNFGNLFYKVFNLFSEIKIPENILTERLMSKKYVQELAALPDKNIFFAGLMQWVGFNQLGIPIKKQNRKGGSTYTFRKRINLMINAITSFTAYPLKILFNLGILISMGSVVASLVLIARKIIQPERILSGYTSLTVVILLSTGLILTAIGVLGIYLEKIFNQVKNRPTFIIKKIHDYEQN